MTYSITPERLALAQRMLDAIDVDRFRRDLEKSIPGGASFVMKTADQQEVRRVMAEGWATHLSDDEMLQVIGFFDSPVGKKYKDTQHTVGATLKETFPFEPPEWLKKLERMIDELRPPA